jgi:hypothetical protein
MGWEGHAVWKEDITIHIIRKKYGNEIWKRNLIGFENIITS